MKVAVISLVEKTMQIGLSGSPNGAAPSSLAVRVGHVAIAMSSKITRPSRSASSFPIVAAVEILGEMPRAFLGTLLLQAEYVVAYADGRRGFARLDVEASDALKSLDRAVPRRAEATCSWPMTASYSSARDPTGSWTSTRACSRSTTRRSRPGTPTSGSVPSSRRGRASRS